MRLITNQYRQDGIFGALTHDSGDTICVTLERSFDGLPAIPRGKTYTCRRYFSPHFGYEVFMLTDVPGHDHIEMHIANVQSELEGCVALGTSIAGAALTESKKAFTKFMALMDGIDEFLLSVV